MKCIRAIRKNYSKVCLAYIVTCEKEKKKDILKIIILQYESVVLKKHPECFSLSCLAQEICYCLTLSHTKVLKRI